MIVRSPWLNSEDSGVTLSRDKAESVYKDCFEFGGRSYVGTDSHVPSVFFALYRDYLKAQEKYTETEKSQRILIVEKDDLNHDYVVHSDVFMKLWRWHVEKGCALLQVDPDIAGALSEECGIWTPDVGIWQDYALLFKPENSGKGEVKIKLAMVFKGEPQYQKIVDYFDCLREKARVMTVRAGGVELFSQVRGRELIEAERERAASGFPRSPELARAWEEFVNCPKRMVTMKKFLEEVLEPYPKGRILDAATGTGCDSIELTKQGFHVISNEIDYELNEIAYKNSRRELPQVLNLTRYNWRDIGEKYKGQLFDAILVLGNSLCLLLDENDRKRCINQFRKILREGGALIIDERNFPYMLSHKKQVLKKGGFPYKKEVIYCGDIVQGRPVSIDEDLVVFEYTHHLLGPRGRLYMYPFKEGELKRMLEDARFTVVQAYKDLKKAKEYTIKEPPDFFTYVAKKQ